ncbi:MAG: DUF2760 domain-containing protein [Victivallales bacterium]|nr:DUF2760 domain-containing protein [Victivallales bacterium]
MANFKTAWNAFWSIFKSDDLAKTWNDIVANPQPALPPAEKEKTEAESQPQETTKPAPVTAKGEAVHTLAILQRESRLIDFLQEDIAPYSNEQIGAAVRKVHDDAHNALEKYFKLTPIRTEAEGETITLDKSFDGRQIRLTGKTAGEPPFRGQLLHRGWKAESINLPQRTDAVDPSVICPAEVEI